MDFSLLLENLRNPALLFFILGIFAVRLKSDLEIPQNSSKFISLYLLFSIGFKGGQELAHSSWNTEILWAMCIGLAAASIIPFYTFFLLKRKFNIYDSAAIAAAYGSVSAVTFVTGISFLEMQSAHMDGHMIAVMAMMEAPAIIIGVLLLNACSKEKNVAIPSIVKHSFSNGSVLLIIGSLIIGFISSDKLANEIKPFTTDIFKGFLAIFLLDMGIVSGRKLNDFLKQGFFNVAFGIIIPLINGIAVAFISKQFISSDANCFILAVLAASASYIAVPAAMRIVAPKANPGIFLPMALAVTFPFNITIGMPIYYLIVQL